MTDKDTLKVNINNQVNDTIYYFYSFIYFNSNCKLKFTVEWNVTYIFKFHKNCQKPFVVMPFNCCLVKEEEKPEDIDHALDAIMQYVMCIAFYAPEIGGGAYCFVLSFRPSV